MSSHANPVNWFEIPVSDLSRVKTFYESALGVEITESEMGPNKMGWFPMDIGQHGFIAHFEDSEGNRVALHESPVGYTEGEG